MRRTAVSKAAFLTVAALGVLLAGCAAAGEGSVEAAADGGAAEETVNMQAEPARLIKSEDTVQADFDRLTEGDTVWVFLYGTETQVRLLGIDTPDTGSDGKKAEAWGAEAGAYTEQRLTGAEKIFLEFDDAAGRTDAYGRTQAWVWADHSLLQEELLERGLAKTVYLPEGCRYADNLKAAQQTAKAAGTGLWGPW